MLVFGRYVFSLAYMKKAADILRGEFSDVSYFGFRVNDGKHANAFIPAGRYLVGYATGDYGATNYIYPDLVRYAKENGLAIEGSVFEEYLIDELSEKDPKRFVMRVFVKIA